MIDYEHTIKAICVRIEKKQKALQAVKDGISLFREWYGVDHKAAAVQMPRFRALIIERMRAAYSRGDVYYAEEERHHLYQSYLVAAPFRFDDYMLALEFDRPAEEQFYLPRRKRLKPFVDNLQKIADRELDELFLSCPPRIGKTTLLMMFQSWCMGRRPSGTNLYSSYADGVTNTYYAGLMAIINDDVTYHWADIFSGHSVALTSAKYCTCHIDLVRHYPTITCRSVDGSLNGSCDCDEILVADDLVSGIEQAMSAERMEKLWKTVDNNLISRAKAGARVLWCGTRWSLHDPIGRRIHALQTDKEFSSVRYVIVNLPALDENDESNFDYDYGVGFPTEYYRRRRASFEHNNDIASWNAQYMQVPVERNGTLFEPGGMRYYNGVLPDAEPDIVFTAVDPAFGGGDFVAAPICAQYGHDVYVVDVIFDKSDKKVTIPRVGALIIKWNVGWSRLECTKATEEYKQEVARYLDESDYKCRVEGKPAPTRVAKQMKIYNKAPDIRDHFVFLDTNYRSHEYQKFMENVYQFQINGTNVHDDAPDALAQAADMMYKARKVTVEVFNRPF